LNFFIVTFIDLRGYFLQKLIIFLVIFFRKNLEIMTETTIDKPPLIIIDWDDTLFPGTWIGSWIPDFAANGMTEVHKDGLINAVDNWRRDFQHFINICKSIGTVYIVTNSDSGWVQLIRTKFCPEFDLESIGLVHTIRNYNIPYIEWKIRAMMGILNTYYGPANLLPKINAAGFGDDENDGPALRTAVTRYFGGVIPCNSHVKTFKFIHRPLLAQLRNELSEVGNNLQSVMTQPINIDYVLTI